MLFISHRTPDKAAALDLKRRALDRGDKRWTFGEPPVGNANYAWIQHFIQRRTFGGGDPNSTQESRT